MTVEQICHVGKIELNDENTHIIQSYAQHIVPWLESNEFREKWASKPYPPLINPEKIDFDGANALHAWTLNIPFPKFYDFVVFGSHGVGITTAMNGFLYLCGAVGIGLSRKAKLNETDDNEKPSNKAAYIELLKGLMAIKTLKDNQKLKEVNHIFLMLNDFIADKDAKKIYSLIDASLALHIVRDPISNLKSLVNNPEIVKKMWYSDESYDIESFEKDMKEGRLSYGALRDIALDFTQDPAKLLKQIIHYAGGKEESKPKNTEKIKKISEEEMILRPKISSVDTWMVDSTQAFHDGVLFQLLSGSLKKCKLKQTSDFIGEKSYDCMCEICEFLGIKKPDESLAPVFSKRAANSVAFLPLTIYANAKTPLFSDEKGSFKDKDRLTSAKIELVTAMSPVASAGYDISKYFSDIDGFDVGQIRVVVTSNDDLIKLLEAGLMDKLKRYIAALVKAIDDEFNAHSKYRFDEKDILDYFKEHKKSRQIMSYIMNQHLLLLKSNKPEIIEGYGWYQKYLEIAKDDEPLDTTQDGVSVTNF